MFEETIKRIEINLAICKRNIEIQNFWHRINKLFDLNQTDRITEMMRLTMEVQGDHDKEEILLLVSSRMESCKTWQLDKMDEIRSAS